MKNRLILTVSDTNSTKLYNVNTLRGTKCRVKWYF